MLRITLLTLALAAAGTADAGAREDLEAFTKGLKGLKGTFTQQVTDPNGRVRERSSGTVALSAPRQFRWEYTRPHPQLIVADGRKVWIHEPDLDQVTVRPQDAEEQANPLAALIDPSRLDKQFVVKEAGTSGGLDWLMLAPRAGGDAGFRTARLGFGPRGLARMQVVDAVGQRTELQFGAWTRNPVFKPATFRYVPPRGVDVIGQG